MRIERVLSVPAWGGHYNDDLAAIVAGAHRDGLFYDGTPITPGFERIRQPSEAASVILLLDTGQTVVGDAMSVAYSGAGGRRVRFRHAEQLPLLERFLKPLEGMAIGNFLDMCAWLERQETPDPRLNRPAADYAISQALLQAVALDRKLTGCEVMARELGCEPARELIPINVQCGEDRRVGVDKAIARRAPVMPHGLINSPGVVGQQGEVLEEYVSWIVARIIKYGDRAYRPELHIDTYGLLGRIFDHDAKRIARYIAGLAARAAPYALCVETPVLMATRAAQIDLFAAIRAELDRLGASAKLIVDEWANDLDDIRAWISAGATDMVNVKSPDLGAISNAARAILTCWEGDLRPILGGSCTDTDQSARVISHVALATKPAWVLARPGMGIDEGFEIVHNEMQRTLAIMTLRRPAV